VRTAGPLALAATAVGSVRPERALRRDAARPGDAIAVSGLPGRAGAARERIARGEPLTAAERAPWVLPPDRVALGRALADAGVRAAIDISDGLLGDLRTLLEASGAGASLELAPLARAAAATGFPLETALGGGEDYELCIAGDPGAIRQAFAAAALPRPILLGVVSEGDALEMHLDGQRYEADTAGWDPFR
jgi:thiamine-monophosphate kinase